MIKEKFKIRNVVNKRMLSFISKDKKPSLRILRVEGSSRRKLIFVDVLVTSTTNSTYEIVLTMSPTTAKIMMEKIKKELNKTEL